MSIDPLQTFTATTADVPADCEAEDFPRLAETPPVDPLESASADTIADGADRPPLSVVEEAYLLAPPTFSLELSVAENAFLERLFDGVEPPIGEAAKFLAALVLRAVPAGREQALAIGKIDEAAMWASAGIERNV